MKGIFHLRPPQPRYTKTWDVNKVLSYLKSLGPNDSLSLKQLTLKTAALLTILAGQRIHTLHMLSVIHIDQSLDMVIFYIIGLTKCSKPTRPNQPIVYRVYVEDEFFVQLNVFMHTWHKGLKLSPKTHPASKDTLARWVRTSIRNSGCPNHYPPQTGMQM